ncbi:MAG TPA: cation-translocating P-type ATPase [Anaerolineaceae bacterium]|nr:cation-translocating P-type ATPase [Anaerolineaceae bacterium]
MSDLNGKITGDNTELTVTWHSLSTEETLARLDTPLAEGLTTAEAQRRLAQYGPNQLLEKPRRTYLQMIIEQLKSFVILLLIGAAILSAVLGEPVEAIAIIAIVLLNTVLGVVQESRAEEALAALKRMSAPDSQVLRDGKRVTVSAPELVPGDIVFLEAGYYIPADVRLIEAVNLRVEEAALTGESVPVQKNAAATLDPEASLGDRKNSAFMGTVVNYGRGMGVITSTGMHTQLGLIATMLQSVQEEQTPLQKKLDQLGKTLGYAALIVCGLVFAVGLIESIEAINLNLIVGLFMIAVSLAVAAVPEGLPAVVTVSLALGMQEMIKRHALIRRLSSVETLGSATVICSDKTGTLTQNEMTVTRVWADETMVRVTGQGYTPVGEFYVGEKKTDLKDLSSIRAALWLGVLNNDAVLEETELEDGSREFRMVGDPTEGSILVAAYKAGGATRALHKAYPRTSEIPFDSDFKRMITVHSVTDPRFDDLSPFTDGEREGCSVVAVKGAPDVVLKLCKYYEPIAGGEPVLLDESKRQRILAANDEMTNEALRVLGVAYRLVKVLPSGANREDLEQELVFVGLIGMIDPARPEVTPALKTATRAGIRTIMITGDYPNTARAIAESIGLLKRGHHVLTGAQLEQISDEELKEEVKKTDVYARVSPEHKLRIVNALQANGEVVAMTGDGVNDAPAIKQADIGISMGITGTDVAKDTADMVLTDDNYVSIVSAVEQGRIIYSNIRKFVYFLISCNMAEILIIFLPTALGLLIFPDLTAEQLSPLAPIQLLWLNLVTDGAPALALSTEKGDPDIMDQPPRSPKEPIINKQMTIGVITQTIAITSVTLLAFWVGLTHRGGSPIDNLELAETMAFVTLSTSELLRAFTARSERYPLLKLGIFSNKWMNIAVLFSLALVIAVVYLPFLNPIFKTVPLGWRQWELLLPLLLIPSIVAEVVKWLIGRREKKQAAQA